MTAEHLTEREVKKLKKAELKAALEARGDREAFEQSRAASGRRCSPAGCCWSRT